LVGAGRATKTALKYLGDQAVAVGGPLRPAFATIAVWTLLSGLSRRTTYNLLGLGLLHSHKRGNTTLIDVDHGLNYLRSLPPAKIKAPKPTRQEEPAA
jgi:hypothetical protein